MELLQEGDVIELRDGHNVYADVPEHFVYENRKGVFSRATRTEVRVGENRAGFPTDYLRGRYVVIKTAYDGGGTGMGPHDVYPDGHHVWCQHMDNGALVDFYQTGAFTAMIPELKPVGRASATWRMEPAA